MNIRELSVPDAYEITPVQWADERGVFLEWFRADKLEAATGRPFTLRQANTSVSRKGVVRGIHYADVPPGQAKYVTVTHGSVVDYVIDVRAGSPTFGQWDSVLLDDIDRRAIFLSEGLGHAFVALSDEATVSYLVSDVYNPLAEHAINPLDKDIALVFPAEAGDPILSSKDTDAPGLAEAAALGMLPQWQHVVDFYAAQRGSGEGR